MKKIIIYLLFILVIIASFWVYAQVGKLPQWVTRGNKTDANDAVAIIEASQRPNLRFVPVISTHQQEIQNLHI